MGKTQREKDVGEEIGGENQKANHRTKHERDRDGKEETEGKKQRWRREAIEWER